MFREMRRFKQQLSENECVEVLKEQNRGILSLIGDDGYPYGVPLDHWYKDANGHLYFHGAGVGHKIDSIKACDKACYTVIEPGVQNEKRRGLDVRSIIVFGRVRLVDDPQLKNEICSALCEKLFPGDVEYAEHEFKVSGARVQCFELVPEHITGKLVNES
jgi:nitroimidazol reductase NimA-like FMN-containing flavoprotein (pyridoxamine 5'-phosphate oxidase superfamily)